MKEGLRFATLAGLAAAAIVAIPGTAQALTLSGSVGISGDCTGINPAVGGNPPAALNWVLLVNNHLEVDGTQDFTPLIAPISLTSLGTMGAALDPTSVAAGFGTVTATYDLGDNLALDLGSLTIGAETHELYADFDSGLTVSYVCSTINNSVTTSLNAPGVSGEFVWGSSTVNFYFGSMGGSNSGGSQTFQGTLSTATVPEPFTMALGAACLGIAAIRRRRR